LQQVVSGSEPEVREKRALAHQLEELLRYVDPARASAAPVVEVLPPYFDELVDLLSRVARRRHAAQNALRALEFIGTETVANAGKAWTTAFPGIDEISAKLASDTVRFLVRSCDLDPWFLESFDAAIEGDLIASRKTAARSETQTAPTQASMFGHGVSQLTQLNGRRRATGDDSETGASTSQEPQESTLGSVQSEVERDAERHSH
jgi:hypothetical protein